MSKTGSGCIHYDPTWMYGEGSIIGGYTIRIVVEWNQDSMREVKKEGRSITVGTCLIESLRQLKNLRGTSIPI